MKRSKMGWIAFSAAAVLIAVGSAAVSAEQPRDQAAAGSKSPSFVGDVRGGVVTVGYVGDLRCDKGSCDAGGCSDSGRADSGCTGSGCTGSGCAGSGCAGSGCGGSGCGGSGCGGSGCGGSGCGGSGRIGSGGCSGCGGADCAGGCGFSRGYGRPDLFYNYFTQGYSNRTNAQMYLSPLPVPPNVGHTYFTYQPFYPHEMLYCHKDKFHNYYDNGRGMNRTRAAYYSPPIRQAASNFYWNYLRLPR